MANDVSLEMHNMNHDLGGEEELGSGPPITENDALNSGENGKTFLSVFFLITQRRSAAKNVGCFRRRLFVGLFVCVSTR